MSSQRAQTTTVRIAALHVYPVKSARGIELSEALLTAAGLADDRRWMVVTPAGRFLTQREIPGLALIQPVLSEHTLQLLAADETPFALALRASSLAPIQVTCWKDRCRAFDEGDEVAAWLGRVLRCECRLVRFDPRQPRLSARMWTGDISAENRFTDGFPLLALSNASLADLNARLARPLPMNRFRPNLVLDGLEPYAEDCIDELYTDGVTLKIVKPCTRCSITTTDQDAAQRDGDEPLRTLKGYRYDPKLNGVLFGQNTIVVAGIGAILHRDQALQVRWKSQPD